MMAPIVLGDMMLALTTYLHEIMAEGRAGWWIVQFDAVQVCTL